jgi:hypothetical protein
MAKMKRNRLRLLLLSFFIVVIWATTWQSITNAQSVVANQVPDVTTVDNTIYLPLVVKPTCSPSSGIEVEFGEVNSGNVVTPSQVNTYSVCATAGDMIRLDISRTSGDFNPNVFVYRPDGTQLCSQWTSGSSLTLLCTLDVSGAYVILIGDWALNHTGGYGFYLQRLNNPGRPAPVNFSDVVPATITSIVEHDTYTVSGAAGDVVRLDISRTNGSFNPNVFVYRPDGTQLCSQWTSGLSLTLVCTLDVSGTHVILIGDWALNHTGGYGVYLQRLNNPSHPAPVNFSDVVPATITSIVEHDTYTVSGAAGDVVRLDISRTSGSFNPNVFVYRPDGTQLCSEWTSGLSLTLVCTLDVSGTHVILIGDWALNHTGGYGFYLQRLNNPSHPVPIAYGDFVAATITSIVEHVTYNFGGATGDTIRLNISRNSGSFNPNVFVYRPDGTQLCSQWTSGLSLTLECTLDASGTHIILIGDWALNHTGGYEMSFTKLN